ncbi:type VI secretion system baseplate subunit TssF [Vibrio sp. SCSIO 43136]|uniref:type VI secretion system baseplate subunit TssF n=1 Tax=Vibrio sp. SCSIO 43136 TaxID=2819101 RepID=UPI002075A870|nr:type VI secretion system baseplate subunit TssF [Vibrio sp. SCSIO 43136]USD66346.1 type VI secretion system baseplate subunit TssF [Vibrio sp. SCSIO 43136]
MSDQLLSYFERELAYVRRALDGFGTQHPEHANELRINQTGQEDPNISRLIDAIALLTAKCEQRLDDQFPEILQNLFNILYPSYLETIPSYAPVSVELDEAGDDAIRIDRGTALSVENGGECRFTLMDDLELAPYKITNINATSAPFNFTTPTSLKRSDAVISVELESFDPEVLFSHMTLQHFDFYVRGFENSARGLIDLLLLNTEVITVQNEIQLFEITASRLGSRIADPSFQWLETEGSQTLGFDLLRDYFAFPDKAAYMRIEALGRELGQLESSKVTLRFFVHQLPVEFLRLFSAQVFALNTAPMLNLFSVRGEPMRYDFTRLSVPVIADVSAGADSEVVAINSVSEVLPTGDITLAPVYEGGYWMDTSLPQWQPKYFWDQKGQRQTEISVSYSELSAQKESVVLSMDLKVCNGRKPCLISTHTEVECLAAVDIPGRLTVTKTPSAPQYPSLDNQLGWRFLAMLNANFSGLVESSNPTQTLQEAMRLCTNSVVCHAAEAIKDVQYSHLVAPITINKQSMFTSGTQVTVVIDDTLLEGEFSAFCQVLNVYFQQYCSFDRFIQLSVERFGSDVAGIEFDKCHGSQLCL